MARAVVLIILCSFFLAGCGFCRVDSEDVSTNFYPPKVSSDQVVYLKNVDKPYDVIGIVKVTTEREITRAEVESRMRSEAAILGADAITDLASEKLPFRIQYTAKAVGFK